MAANAVNEIIMEGPSSQPGTKYQIRDNILDEDTMKFALAEGIPEELAVDKVLTHPAAYELHMKINKRDPIINIMVGDMKSLKSGGKSKRGDMQYNQDAVTWWTSIKFDYGIGITDVLCMEHVVLDIGKRSGEASSRYLQEYANVAIPTGLSNHLLHRLTVAASYQMQYKKNIINGKYMWINMNMTDGLSIKSALYRREVEEGEEYESLVISPLLASDMLNTPSRAVSCNLFFTVGNSMTLSANIQPHEMKHTSVTTITTKIVAIHVTSKEPEVQPIAVGQAKRY